MVGQARANPGSSNAGVSSPRPLSAVLIEIVAAQILDALAESGVQAEGLTGAFRLVAEGVEELSNVPEVDAAVGLEDARALRESIRTAAMSGVVAMQFYDRLSQRLQPIAASLTAVTAALADPERGSGAIDWNALAAEMRVHYPPMRERALFEHLLRGSEDHDAAPDSGSERDGEGFHR